MLHYLCRRGDDHRGCGWPFALPRTSGGKGELVARKFGRRRRNVDSENDTFEEVERKGRSCIAFQVRILYHGGFFLRIV